LCLRNRSSSNNEERKEKIRKKLLGAAIISICQDT
jgi:hypothetical protein